MNAKKESRLRRARRARAKMRELGVYRLCVNRTPRHIYAQIISPDGGKVLASASTLDKDYFRFPTRWAFFFCLVSVLWELQVNSHKKPGTVADMAVAV